MAEKYHIETGIASPRTGNVSAWITVPLKEIKKLVSNEANGYDCMTKKRFIKLKDEGISPNIDWRRVIAEYILPRLDEQPYLHNNIKKVTNVKAEGKNLELECIIAPIESYKADLPLNLDLRTNGNVGRYSKCGIIKQPTSDHAPQFFEYDC